VTLVMRLRGELASGEALAYVLVQVLAAVAGVLLAHAMFELPLWQPGDHVRSGGAQWLSEGVATFGLLLTILLGVRHRPAAVPALVASYIFAAYWFTASTSFANPAVTLARSLHADLRRHPSRRRRRLRAGAVRRRPARARRGAAAGRAAPAMTGVREAALPDASLLRRYADDDGYADAYAIEVDRLVAFEDYVAAFYSTRLFALERFVLMLVGRSSSTSQVRALVRGERDRFAAWTVEARARKPVAARRRHRSHALVADVRTARRWRWYPAVFRFRGRAAQERADWRAPHGSGLPRPAGFPSALLARLAGRRRARPGQALTRKMVLCVTLL
jgi:hypothetical protein